MNLPNIIALTLGIGALAFLAFGLNFAVAPFFMEPEVLLLPDLAEKSFGNSEMHKRLGAALPWLFAGGILLMFSIPSVFLAGASFLLWWFIGRHLSFSRSRRALLAVRCGGFLSYLLGGFFLLWSGVIVLASPLMPVFLKELGIPEGLIGAGSVRAHANASALLCLTASMLAWIYGAGLVRLSSLQQRNRSLRSQE